MWIDVTTSPYNATGDGSTDDTDAINAALAAAAVYDPEDPPEDDTRNAVYFPPGTYRITNTLNLTRNMGVRLIGVGNVKGTPAFLGGYAYRQTSATLFWDAGQGGVLMRFFGSNYNSVENLTFVGSTPQKYQFNPATGGGDPTDGFLAFDDETFADVTEIYISAENFFKVDVSGWLDRASAGRLTIYKELTNRSVAFDITGISGTGDYRTLSVVPVQIVGDPFTFNEELIVSFVSAGCSPQAYEFSDATGGVPDDGILYFNDDTFGEITAIVVAKENANGLNPSGWLSTIAGTDERVTIQHANDPAIYRIFKVTATTDAHAYITLTVTPVVTVGTLNDEDPVLLIASKVGPIRDRADSLFKQQSDGGFPAGHMIFHNCTFIDATNGVELDDATPTNNCADNIFQQCSFLDCENGILSNSVQVLNNTLQNCDFNSCAIAINHRKGGDIRVFGASMNGYTGGLFLSVEGGGGNNASTFELYGVRLEMKAGKPALLKTSGGYDEKNVIIDGFSWVGPFWPEEYSPTGEYFIGNTVRLGNTIYESLTGDAEADPPEPNEGNDPLTSPSDWKWLGDWVRPVQLKGQTNCMMRGVTIKGPLGNLVSEIDTGPTPDITFRPTLLLNNCRMSYAESDVVTADSTSLWQMTQCTAVYGDAFDNIGNWPLDPQYVIAAGKAGGQTVYGGTVASENLTLVSTLNGTKGNVVVGPTTFAANGNVTMASGAVLNVDGGTVSGGTAASQNLTLVSTSNNTKGAIILGANIFRVGPGDVARLAQYPLQFASSTGASDDVGIKRSAAGILQITNASTGLGSLLIGSSATGNTSVTIRAIASQAANLTSWQNSSSTILLQVTKDGYLTTATGGQSDSAGLPALDLTATGGNGGNAPAGGVSEDKPGGDGGDVLLTGGTGGDAIGEGGFGNADAGAGGSVKLQAGLPGAPAGTGAAVAGEVVVNDAGHATNFRVESNDDVNCIFVSGANNRVGIKTSAPTAALDINSDTLRLRTANAPGSVSATGTQGDIRWGSDGLYVCISTDTWRKATLATF